jgi:hypothetical protein
MEPEKALKLIEQFVKVRDDGKNTLSCHSAFKIAAEHNISIATIGNACDTADIKIMACQLGCFK